MVNIKIDRQTIQKFIQNASNNRILNFGKHVVKTVHLEKESRLLCKDVEIKSFNWIVNYSETDRIAIAKKGAITKEQAKAKRKR